MRDLARRGARVDSAWVLVVNGHGHVRDPTGVGAGVRRTRVPVIYNRWCPGEARPRAVAHLRAVANAVVAAGGVRAHSDVGGAGRGVARVRGAGVEVVVRIAGRAGDAEQGDG